MNWHVESTGAGEPLLLLHGWGMHSGVWGSVATQLAQNFRVHCIDLPGHGYSETITPYNLDALVQALSAYWHKQYPSRAISLCGWSLGGQIALRWAQCVPAQIRRLMLLSCTPCFVQRADWVSAMPADTLHEFSQALQHNTVQTLQRFIALQVHGGEHERALRVQLRKHIFARGQPHHAALASGLDILRDVDLRAELAQIGQPTLLISGGRDGLTPSAASAYMAQQLPYARLLEIAGAAHVPFLSHPDEVLAALQNFAADH